MKTVSYSLDEETAAGIETLAKQAKMSRSDVVRQLYARMQLEQSLDTIATAAAPTLQRLGLMTDDDIAAYIKTKP